MKKTLLIIAALVLVAFSSCKKEDNTVEPTVYSTTKVIDLEHHYYNQEFIDCLETRTELPYYRPGEGIWIREGSSNPIDFIYPWKNPFTENPHSLDLLTSLGENRLKFIDYAGVTLAAVSSGSCIEELPLEEAVLCAQKTNNAIAEAVKLHPDRYVGTISLPTPYVEEAIAELERAVNELGLKYWHTHSNYGDECLFNEKFEPLIAKCAELNVPIYIHPQSPYGDYLIETGNTLAGATFGYGVDVARTTLRLILNGVFDKYPNLKIIVGHMGEFIPYCLGRMDNRISWITPEIDSTVYSKETLGTYFERGNIFVTTSGVFEEPVMTCAISTIGIDRIMFGTDFPYEDFKGAVDFVKNLPISNEDKDKIFYKNAETYILK